MMFSERGIFIKFRMNPHSFPVVACVHLRRWIESSRPDFLSVYYEAISQRLAANELEAELLALELTRIPPEFTRTPVALAVRSANQALISGESFGALN